MYTDILINIHIYNKFIFVYTYIYEYTCMYILGVREWHWTMWTTYTDSRRVVFDTEVNWAWYYMASFRIDPHGSLQVSQFNTIPKTHVVINARGALGLAYWEWSNKIDPPTIFQDSWPWHFLFWWGEGVGGPSYTGHLRCNNMWKFHVYLGSRIVPPHRLPRDSVSCRQLDLF